MSRTLQGFLTLKTKLFPGAFAAVDDCHIAIKCHDTDKGSYYNQKGFHSILLQGACSADCRFLDVFVGWPDAAHDTNSYFLCLFCPAYGLTITAAGAGSERVKCDENGVYIYIRVGQKIFFPQNMVRKLPKHVHIDNK